MKKTPIRHESCSDYPAECIRAFLAHVTLLGGCCWCGDTVHRGRGAIERLACSLVDENIEPPSFADCADILNFMGSLQLQHKSSCFACDQDGKAVGFNEIMRFVRGRICEQVKASKKGARK